MPESMGILLKTDPVPANWIQTIVTLTGGSIHVCFHTDQSNLSELLKTPARQLSLGQRMRCEIAASLLHSPSILFLDEPTIGLDAVSKLAVRDFIKQLNQDHKTTVILTTHDMQDIEALTNRILLIGKGRILMDGSPEELKQDAASMDEAVVKLYRSFDENEGR